MKNTQKGEKDVLVARKKYAKNCSSDLKLGCKGKQDKFGCCDNFSFAQRLFM